MRYKGKYIKIEKKIFQIFQKFDIFFNFFQNFDQTNGKYVKNRKKFSKFLNFFGKFSKFSKFSKIGIDFSGKKFPENFWIFFSNFDFQIYMFLEQNIEEIRGIFCHEKMVQKNVKISGNRYYFTPFTEIWSKGGSTWIFFRIWRYKGIYIKIEKKIFQIFQKFDIFQFFFKILIKPMENTSKIEKIFPNFWIFLENSQNFQNFPKSGSILVVKNFRKIFEFFFRISIFKFTCF